MASKVTEVKKNSNNKSILSQSNGTAEKTSPKSAPSLKSPVKASAKTTTVKNGTDSTKQTNGSAIKKMETGIGSPPKVARSPSAKSITPPNKSVKTSVENGFKSNGIEVKNSQGDCSSTQPAGVRGDLIVDNGVVHSDGNCGVVMLSMEAKLKENHFNLDSADNHEEIAASKNGHADDVSKITALDDNKGDSVEVVDKTTFKAEHDPASGDKVCVKDKPEMMTVKKQESVEEKYEDAKSELNDSAHAENDMQKAQGSPDSNMTGYTQSSDETVKIGSESEREPEVTKQSIREKVWDHLEKNDLVHFPRPCIGRIPNFKGAPAAAEKLCELDIFKKSKTIKVNPDKPQEMLRFFVLEVGKRLLVPVPRLREGLFQAVVPPMEASTFQLRQASQRYGMKKWGRPISLEEKVLIDLIVLGSVAVDRKGHRIGKGEGFADLEFAMLMKMNAINENTVIATLVHDDQIFDELPEHLFKEHDVPVDWIITGTQVIEIKEKLPRPSQIFWNILSNRRILEIPMLQDMVEEKRKLGEQCDLKEVDSDVEEKPYLKRYNRRRRFNYSRATGDPVRDNNMYDSPPPRMRQYSDWHHNMPSRGPYMQQHHPPMNRMNSYGSPMMRNDSRPVYYQERPYIPRQQQQQMGPRPQRMRETRPRSDSRGNRPMNHGDNTGRPRSHSRSRSMNRSFNMNRPNGRMPRSRRLNSDPHQVDTQYVMNSPNMTKSVQVQTVNKLKSSRTNVKRRRAPIEFSLRVKNIGMGVRVRDLKVALNERGVKPRDITWRGYKGFAFLHFVKQAGKENNPCSNIEEVIKTLKDLPLAPKDKKTLVIEPLKGKQEDGGESATANEETSVSVKGTTTEVASDRTIAA